jgi:hypothetical protein
LLAAGLTAINDTFGELCNAVREVAVALGERHSGDCALPQ